MGTGLGTNNCVGTRAGFGEIIGTHTCCLSLPGDVGEALVPRRAKPSVEPGPLTGRLAVLHEAPQFTALTPAIRNPTQRKTDGADLIRSNQRIRSTLAAAPSASWGAEVPPVLPPQHRPDRGEGIKPGRTCAAYGRSSCARSLSDLSTKLCDLGLFGLGRLSALSLCVGGDPSGVGRRHWQRVPSGLGP